MTTNRSLMAAVLGLGLALVTLPGAAGARPPAAAAPGPCGAAAAAPARRPRQASSPPTAATGPAPRSPATCGRSPARPRSSGSRCRSGASPAPRPTRPRRPARCSSCSRVTTSRSPCTTAWASRCRWRSPASRLPRSTAGSTRPTGVAPGGSAAYTFTASRPGTFVYEAGHTADGARQVAMGLAGALVVLPADASGAYGSRATAYDDDAVLVLSDVDPELNAAPMKFDMRSFRARYRLINGKAFPTHRPGRDRPGPHGAAALRRTSARCRTRWACSAATRPRWRRTATR